MGVSTPNGRGLLKVPRLGGSVGLGVFVGLRVFVGFGVFVGAFVGALVGSTSFCAVCV